MSRRTERETVSGAKFLQGMRTGMEPHTLHTRVASCCMGQVAGMNLEFDAPQTTVSV